MTTAVNADIGATTITTLGTVTTGTWNGTVSLTGGGTNANIAASNGGVVYSTASALALLSGTATANQALLSGATAAPTWSTATYPLTFTAGGILYASAANVIGRFAVNTGVIVSAAAGPVLVNPNGVGKTIIGSNGSQPVAAQIGVGTGITAAYTTNITFSLAAPTNQTATSVTMTAGTFYLANAASLITLTLAASPTVGDTYIIVGIGAGGWTVAQNASQLIKLPGGVATTAGVGGSLSSNNRYDCVTITYSETANTFVATNIVGNIIYV